MSKLIKTLELQQDFSDSECMISTYLLTHFRQLAGMTTRQLAKNTYTNSAAIVRFCQKLGFSGYTEFKVQFLAEMIQHIHRPSEENFILSDHDNIHALIEKVTTIEIDALKTTRTMLNPDDFIKALKLFSKTNYIDFYATDNNLDIAHMASASFIMANKTSIIHNPMTMQYLQATTSPNTHIGFFISRTGNNRMLIDIARLLKLRHIPFMLITAESNSELASLADIVFNVANVKNMNELGPRVFLLGAKYVTDILFSLLMTKIDFNESQQKEQWLNKHFRY